MNIEDIEYELRDAYARVFERAYLALIAGDAEPAKAVLQSLTGRVVETGTRYLQG